MNKILISTARLNIYEAVESEIETIIDIESNKENRDYLWIGTYDEHKFEIADPNHLLLIFKTKSVERVVGYALIRLDFSQIYLKFETIFLINCIIKNGNALNSNCYARQSLV